MRRVASFVAIALLVLAGCGMWYDAMGYGTDDRPYLLTGSGSEPLREVIPADGPGGVELRIRAVDHTMLGIEGYVVFARLEAKDGTTVMDMRVPDDAALVVQVPAGDYAFTGYYRSCDANCGYLDPPGDLCETELALASGVPSEVVISVTNRDCRLG
jgi:hypothetical protein